MYGMGKTDDLRALEKNCQLNSGTMLAQKRKKQKIILINLRSESLSAPEFALLFLLMPFLNLWRKFTFN